MEKVILISGLANSGKDTTANMIKSELEQWGRTVLVLHFADYIKRYCVMMGWDGETKDEYWRGILQTLGTEKIRQELNMPNFHVGRICEDVQILSDEYDYFLIPDTRFPNEVHYTRAIFPEQTMDIRVVRSNFESALTDEQKNHPSETALNGFNFTHEIYNDGNLDDLYDAVYDFVKFEILEVGYEQG